MLGFAPREIAADQVTLELAGLCRPCPAPRPARNIKARTLHPHDHHHHGRADVAPALGFSLLPISAGARLAITGLLLLSLWALVVWALL